MSTNETLSGVLNIDKPAGITSHDVVDDVRKLLKIKRVGHTGTLDPFATGVLLVVVGSATRLMEYTHAWGKTYEATLTLGATSDTDDLTGKITPHSDTRPEKEALAATLTTFMGTIQQIPPTYAAIKVAGKKLYEYARAGEEVARVPRAVTIHSLELLEYNYPQARVRVVCSSGTYIRALARDIGASLDTGAYLSALRRTEIGTFDITEATPLASLSAENISSYLLSSTRLVEHLSTVHLSPDNVAQCKQGRAVPWSQPVTTHQPIALFDESNQLIGIGQTKNNDGEVLLHPIKIIS